jgi:hypothetical protein
MKKFLCDHRNFDSFKPGLRLVSGPSLRGFEVAVYRSGEEMRIL